MQSRYITNHDENIIRIVFDRVPQTGTLGKLSEALNLLDASVNAICDARITTALDTSSIQTLWSVFNEYDYVTSAALTDLDYRLTALDASLGEFSSQNRAKFVSLDSSLSGLQTSIDDVRNDLSTHINDTSNISGSVKPEDIEQFLTPIRDDLYNTSVNLNGRINDAVSRLIDCEHDISTLYNVTNITNRGAINDVSNRLFNLTESYNVTTNTVAFIQNQYVSLNSAVTTNTNDIANINASVTSLSHSVIQNASVLSNQALPNLRALNTSVNDISTRLASVLTVPDALDSITNDIENINASVGVIKYNDNLRDASIIALREYQTNTVDSLLSSYTQRLNNAESLAVDSQYIANDVSNRLSSALAGNIATVNNIADSLNSSVNSALTNHTSFVNQSVANMNTSVNSVLNDIDRRDFVTAAALNLHDTSINYIITVLRNHGLIN